MTWNIIVGDSRKVLPTLPDESVHCIVTSPPYLGLRSYKAGEAEIGKEPSPEEYVEALVQVFHEARRVLHRSGTLWLNLGDALNGSGGAGGDYSSGGLKAGQPRFKAGRDKRLKPKDMMMLPARVALALQADGWWLRSDIIWEKKSCMPESVTDRPTKSYEHIFLLTKAARYFYDWMAIAEPLAYPNETRRPMGSKGAWEIDGRRAGDNGGGKPYGGYPSLSNKRDVWSLGPEPFNGARYGVNHYATFPTEIPRLCISAGSSEKGVCSQCGAPWERITKRVKREHGLAGVGFPKTDAIEDDHNGHKRLHRRVAAARAAGEEHDNPLGGYTSIGWRPTCKCNASVVPATILDPFSGAGTTVMVAERLGRDGIGIELSPEYAEMSRRRILDDCPMFNSVGGDDGRQAEVTQTSF